MHRCLCSNGAGRICGSEHISKRRRSFDRACGGIEEKRAQGRRIGGDWRRNGSLDLMAGSKRTTRCWTEVCRETATHRSLQLSLNVANYNNYTNTHHNSFSHFNSACRKQCDALRVVPRFRDHLSLFAANSGQIHCIVLRHGLVLVPCSKFLCCSIIFSLPFPWNASKKQTNDIHGSPNMVTLRPFSKRSPKFSSDQRRVQVHRDRPVLAAGTWKTW